MSIEHLLHRPTLQHLHKKTVHRWEDPEDLGNIRINAVSSAMSGKSSEWSEHYDADSASYFYVNSLTGETQWEPPPDFQLDSSATAAATAADEWSAVLDEDSGTYFYVHNTTGDTTWENPFAEATDRPDDSNAAASTDAWTEQQDETGAVFYYNSSTGESSWERPNGLNSATEEHSGGADTESSEWEEVQDDDGNVFFYNATSGETRWDAPTHRDSNAAEWVERFDESSGMTYFENTHTLETQWENPYEGDMQPISMDTVDTMASPAPTSNMSLFASQDLHLPAFSPNSRTNPKDRRLLSPSAGPGGDGIAAVDAQFGAPEEYLNEFLELESKDLPDMGADGTSGNGDAVDIERSAQQISALTVLDGIDAMGQQVNASKAAEIIVSVPTALLQTNVVLSHLTKKLQKSFTIEKFAENAFQYDRRVNSRSANQPHPIEKMLSYQAEPLKSPLTALSSSHLNTEALASFRTIQLFMSTGSKSEAPPLELIDELLTRFMNAPAELQDEIYCQLCKQTRRNPSVESASMAWQLLLVSLAAVPPSKRILAHLINYFSSCLQQLNSNAGTAGAGDNLITHPSASVADATALQGRAEREVEKFVYLCLKSCAPAAAAPPRSELLLPLEIRSILLGESMEIDVYTLDYRYQRCRIDSFSTINDLASAVCKRLGVGASHSIIFSLYEAQYEEEDMETMSLLNGSVRVVDWVAHCERVTVNAFGSDGEDRELGLPQQAEHMLYVTSSPAKHGHGAIDTRLLSPQQHQLARTMQHAKEEWNSPATFANGIPQKLFFKAQYMFEIVEHLDDEVTAHLLYLQAQYDVYTAHYAHSHADATLLAALKLQEVYGDFMPGTRFLAELSKHSQVQIPMTLHRLISPHVLSNAQGSLHELEQRIINQYKALVGIPRSDVRGMYLMFVSSWKLFGATFFVVDGHVNSNSNQFSEVVLSISARSIILIDAARDMTFLAEYSYEDVMSWGYSFDAFVLVLGSKSAQVKSYFKTAQGKAIDSLVNVYQKHFHRRRRAVGSKVIASTSPAVTERKTMINQGPHQAVQ